MGMNRRQQEGKGMSKRILVVDDKANIRRLLQEYLTEQGYAVTTAENGKLALFTTRREPPDLILLDILMPEMDGYTFLQQYRQEAQTPIIFLTAKLEETDKVIGLELGADDYITKPFSMRELLARIRAVLRRTGEATSTADVLRVANVVLDKSSRQVMVGDQAVKLTPSEFDLLAALMRAPGRVFARQDLLEHLPGEVFEGAERSIDVHIRHLRKKIEPDPQNPRYVETVFGVGYRFAQS